MDRTADRSPTINHLLVNHRAVEAKMSRVPYLSFHLYRAGVRVPSPDDADSTKFGLEHGGARTASFVHLVAE